MEYHQHDFEWQEHADRVLEEYKDTISENPNLDEEEKLNVLGKEARGHWELFHTKHGGKSYKDRRYLNKAFPILNEKGKSLLELGCGYGSSLLPLIESNEQLMGIGCDFSKSAIATFTERIIEKKVNDRCLAFECDIVHEDFNVEPSSIDIVLLVFCFSAIPPSAWDTVVEKINKVLKPGGVVCFRDYGLYDMTMLRSKNRLIKDVYARPDGTLAAFCSKGIKRLN